MNYVKTVQTCCRNVAALFVAVLLVSCGSAGVVALNNAQNSTAGRDANAATNGSTSGKPDFRFTSIPATGSDTGGCVLDNTTGLMWEVKTTDGGLRDWSKTYTNYDSTLAAQKWNGVNYLVPTQTEIDAATNSIGFKNSVNAQGLCGFSDWRLPTVDELQNIVDYGVASPGPAIVDATWFPNTQGGLFWTATRIIGVTGYAWYVYFGNGYVGPSSLRSDPGYVRLVRTGQ